MEVWRENEVVIVKIAYDKNLIAQLKSIGGGKWDSQRSAWQFPSNKYNTLIAVKMKLDHHKPHQSGIVYRHFSQEHNEVHRESKAYKTHFLSDDVLTHMRQYMSQGGYSPKSIKNYINHVRRFLAFSQNRVDIYWVNTYMVELLENRKCSHAYCNQAINAIKLYFKQQGISDQGISSLLRPKKEFKLPKVMSKAEVKALFDHTENLKHKTALMFAYSCGMRVSEVANLKLMDIDTDRMVVIIRQSKGRKDRIVPLSRKLLNHFEDYEKRFRPYEWVFDNQMRNGPISSRTLQNVFNQSKLRAGIRENATFHSLRHSYATHLLDSGIDLRLIQELLGHASSKTTEIYTHVTTQTLEKIVNPLDEL